MVLKRSALPVGRMPRKVPFGRLFSTLVIDVPKPASWSTRRHSFRPMPRQLGTSTIGCSTLVGLTKSSFSMPSRAAVMAGFQMPTPASPPELPRRRYFPSRMGVPWMRRSSSLIPLKRSWVRSMPIIAAPARLGV